MGGCAGGAIVGQRQLHEDPVDRLVDVQAVDEREELIEMIEAGFAEANGAE